MTGRSGVLASYVLSRNEVIVAVMGVDGKERGVKWRLTGLSATSKLLGPKRVLSPLTRRQ